MATGKQWKSMAVKSAKSVLMGCSPESSSQQLAERTDSVQRLEVIDGFQSPHGGAVFDRLARALDELSPELARCHGDLGAAFGVLHFARKRLPVRQAECNPAR